MRILVTGGTGFIGSHLVNKLIKMHHYVRILTRKEIKIPKVEVIKGDIRNIEVVKKAIKDVDVVFHLAAVTTAKNIKEDIYWKVNVQGTKNIVKASIETVKKFILCSTAKVLGPSSKPLSEDSIPRPKNIYEKTKLESENIAKMYFENDSRLVIIRPSFTYGPKSQPIYNLLKFLEKSRFIVGSRNLTQPLYIDDLVDAFILSLKKAKGCYIVAGEEPISMKEFIELVVNFLNQRKRFYLPTFFLKPAKLFFPYLVKCFRLNISKDLLDAFENSYIYDISKIKKELEWKPKVNLREGIKKTIDWFKNLRL